MKAKAGNSKNSTAIEQWLKKKPLDQFARRVTTPAALREPVKQLLLRSLQPEEVICGMIDVPPQGICHPQRVGEWLRKIWQLWELSPDRLVALTDRRLLVISTTSMDVPPQLTSIPIENILYLEHGTILLFSWLRICWHENQMAREEVIYFNSVDEYVFMPLIRMLRRSAARQDLFALAHPFSSPVSTSRWDEDSAWVAQLDRDALGNLPLKFLNLIPRYGLLQEERICQVLFRPALWSKRFGLKRVMTDPQMVIVRTDFYLLLAAENVSHTSGNYGLILTFLPCRFIKAVSTSQNGEHCTLNIALETQKTTREWSLPFPPEMNEQVGDFARSRMETRTAG